MEWIERLNKAMDYLEDHIKEEIEYDQLAEIADCSAYHFQRMFSYMADMPLSEYIRRRKMSLAAIDLQYEDSNIADTAQAYGYQSPTAFNRAFQSVHGIAPSAVKKAGTDIKVFPPIVFQMAVKGTEELQYRMVEKDAFSIVGISTPLHKELEQNFMAVPALWQQAAENGTIPRLFTKMNAEPFGLLGVSACNHQDEWRYYIAVSSTQEVEEDLDTYIVPSATWAIFEGSGTGQSIQELEQRVVLEWLPDSGYEYTNAPDIEVYLNDDPSDARYEVWIPVVKRQRSHDE